MLMRNLLCLFVFIVLGNSVQATNNYLSEVDLEIQIKKIVLVPFLDNANGIYSTRIQNFIGKEVEKDHQFDLVKSDEGKLLPSTNPDYFSENPQEVIKILNDNAADSLISGRITQGPQGIQGKLVLFHGKTGRPLLQAELNNYKIESITGLEDQFSEMYKSLKKQLPYQGILLSRNGNSVTLNAGSHHGAKAGDTASIIQFLKIQRHPKHQFLVTSEREVLGKIRLTQVEEFLSFGTITHEKESQLLRSNHKVALDRFIVYENPALAPGQDPNYGENPQEWKPVEPPQYGRVQLLGGISQYSQSATLRLTGNITADSNLTPNVFALGEAWISQNFFVNLELQQAIFSVKNPLSGSTPDTLNMSYSKYNLYGTYNLPLSAEFFGPRVQFHGGLHRYESRATHSSPISFASHVFGGMYFGVTGNIPINETFDVGLHFKYFITSNASESSSETSGTPGKPTINSIGFLGVYRMKPNFNIAARFDLDYYSVDFNRTTANRTNPATNSNHKIHSALVGIEYLF